MNTIELHRSTIHPPDTGDRQILTIPVPADRTRLTPAERLSLRLGLWLIERSARAAKTISVARLARPAVTERDALTLLTYDLQRQLR